MLHTILSYAAYLVCPLMMLFCMKGMFGMFGGNKSCSHDQAKQPTFSSKKEELEYVRAQMTDLQARYECLASDGDSNGHSKALTAKEKIQQA